MNYIKAVLDTNIFVSSILAPSGNCAQVIRLWTEGKFILCVSDEILNEICKVLAYPSILKRHRLDEKEILEFISYIRDYSFVTPGRISLDIVKEDPSDNKFLECAVEAKAEYVVSGDSHLLCLNSYENISIISPAGFLKIIHRDASGYIPS